MSRAPARKLGTIPGIPAAPHRWVLRTLLVVLAAVPLAFWGWWIYRTDALWTEAQAAAKGGDWAMAERALGRMAWYRTPDRDAMRLRIRAAKERGDRGAAARLLGQVQGTPAEM